MTDKYNTNDIKTSIFSPKHWIRLIYMLLFALMLHVASIVMWVLCAMQFIISLITDKNNENLRYLGKSITRFIGQALDFLTYNTEVKPFPFAEWPADGTSDSGGTSLVVIEESTAEEETGEDEKPAHPGTSGETGRSSDTDQSDESGHGLKPGE